MYDIMTLIYKSKTNLFECIPHYNVHILFDSESHLNKASQIIKSCLGIKMIS